MAQTAGRYWEWPDTWKRMLSNGLYSKAKKSLMSSIKWRTQRSQQLCEKKNIRLIHRRRLKIWNRASCMWPETTGAKLVPILKKSWKLLEFYVKYIYFFLILAYYWEKRLKPKNGNLHKAVLIITEIFYWNFWVPWT